MKHFVIFVLVSLLVMTSCKSSLKAGKLNNNSGNNPAAVTYVYILNYKALAVEEMHRAKIPASITLAQGILESGNGQSYLATNANNHFGIKCKATWPGGKVYMDDDARNECFRSYGTVEESYRDHSNFLVNSSRYSFLFQYDVTDYKSWAHGLKKAGYATRPDYAERLIDIIELHKLYELDRGNDIGFNFSMGDDKVITVNGVSAVTARYGDTWEGLALRVGIKLEDLLKFNDANKETVIIIGMHIFLSTKKNRGKESYHIVQDGEDMYFISQIYGIKLDRLLKMNHLPYDRVPETGEIIYLRNSRVDEPRTMSLLEYDKRYPKKPMQAIPPKEDKVKEVTEPVKAQNVVVPVKTDSDVVVEVVDAKDIIVATDSNKVIVVSENTNEDYHIVQTGETLFTIARKYNLSVAELMQINNMKEAVVKTGDKLYIRKNNDVKIDDSKKNVNTVITEDNKFVPVSSRYDTSFHFVKPLEDLYSISRMYSITIIDLITVNKLEVYELETGQKMIVQITDKTTGKKQLKEFPQPAKEVVKKEEKKKVTEEVKKEEVIKEEKPVQQPAPGLVDGKYHIVQPAQTLYSISRLYYVSVDKIKALNGLKDNTIQVGQKLRIK